MTNEEIVAYRAKERAFAKTDLGKAFLAFESATARAWIFDTEDRFNDRDSEATKNAWEKQASTRKVIREMLEKLA
jgi:hypothetical protein